MGSRVGPLWQIKQAPEEIQGRNTQCELSERKRLRGSGNTIPQDTRYHGGNCHTIKDKDTRYKLCWNRKDKGTSVGVFVAEEWIERIILVKLIVGQPVVTFLSVYALQSGLSDEVKDLFFDQLCAVTVKIQGSEFLIPCGDWNGHVGHAGIGYREVHGGMGHGRQNQMLRVREP